MAKKEFTYRGKTLDELKALTLNELAELLPARQRRSIRRGLNDEQKKLIERIKTKKSIRTQLRDMIILPDMVSKTINIHNGKNFKAVIIEPEMIGHLLGEFALTRNRVAHSAPGVGATKSSSSISVR
ncbi:MAG: 30S ribosomal protein S19 [archaeon]